MKGENKDAFSLPRREETVKGEAFSTFSTRLEIFCLANCRVLTPCS
jgi:hypothetical protein